MSDAVNMSWGLVGLAFLQAIALLLIAPLMSGISRQIRARMHTRQGPGILRDYQDILKLFSRQDLAPNGSAAIFRATPFVLLGTMLVAAMTLPIIVQASPMRNAGDLITLIYLFALYRFFFSLSGLDSGSIFAGIGASRELVLGVLIEPILILALLVIALIAGSTDIGNMSALSATSWGGATPAAALLALVAGAFAVFVEMGKIPFDYAEAEQELQEGPLTEYSGAGLAIVKLGLSMKQVVMASLFIGIFLPFGSAAEPGFFSVIFASVMFFIKLVVLYIMACVFENTLARGRFLLTSRVTWVGFAIAAMAFVFYLTGL